MKKSKKRNYAVIALIVLLIALAVGYAAFSATLTINGTAAAKATWDVKFTSAQLLDSSDKTADAEKYGTVSFTDTTVTADVKLNYPGDAVKLKVVVTNAGTLPAKLTNFNITNPTNADISVTAAQPATNEVLAANGGTCTTEYVIKWAAASTATKIDDTFTVTFNYTQDTTEVNITPSHSDTGNS